MSVILRDNSLKQHEFVKCLMQCQEYISLEDYPRAFKQCEYIKNNLELKSAQLYEFYFISYFKIKGGEDSIIQDIENNKFDTISNLELYAKRCKKFNQEFHSTSTAEENIEIICRKLSDTLKERYLSIHFNYINFGNNIDIRNNIEKYINCGIDLVTEININKKLITSFLEFALIELNGGGRLDWIEVSSDWKIYNKTDSFNSIKKREQIEIIIRKRGRLEFTKKMLYKNLGLKYSNIKLNDDKSNILTATESTIKFIKSSIVAYKFYEDITFLELAFEELQGKGRISWYELNENNKIVPNKNCNKFNYNPYNDLIRIINKFGEKDAQSSTFNKILKDIVDYVSRQKELENLNQKILQIEKRYNEVEIVRLENGEIENDLEIRKEIINCIRLWWEMFLESRDQDKTLHKCIDELSGKGKLLWFNAEFVNNKDFLIVNHPNCNVLNFDAHNYLNDFCKKSSEYTDEEKMLELNNSIKLKIAEKLVYSANTKYNSI